MNDLVASGLETVTRAVGGEIRPASVVTHGGLTLCLVQREDEDRLAVITDAAAAGGDGFFGVTHALADGRHLRDCPIDRANAAALRRTLPWLQPRPLGRRTSVGFGDRLGMATPGHVAALRRAGADARIAPVLAQQSMREMVRARRDPREVVDAATWGAFASGWRGPIGADADHLMTIDDVDACVGAFTTFTLDPKAVVDPSADHAPAGAIEQAIRDLPWVVLDSSPTDSLRRYVGARLAIEDRTIVLSEETARRAMAKYGRAVAHVLTLYRHLSARATDVEVEVAVDETASPTSPEEHFYMASELERLGVAFVSFSPRLVGRFEKGVAYRGNLDDLRTDLVAHAAVARAGQPHKLSIHSGSDKFDIYQMLSEATGGEFHLKTSGTSYLEALRVLATHEPDLFRRTCTVAARSFATDRASYGVSAPADALDGLPSMSERSLPGVLHDDASRQILHVTFGSVLATLGGELRAALRQHRSEYETGLGEHLGRHLEPLMLAGVGPR